MRLVAEATAEPIRRLPRSSPSSQRQQPTIGPPTIRRDVAEGLRGTDRESHAAWHTRRRVHRTLYLSAVCTRIPTPRAPKAPERKPQTAAPARVARPQDAKEIPALHERMCTGCPTAPAPVAAGRAQTTDPSECQGSSARHR